MPRGDVTFDILVKDLGPQRNIGTLIYFHGPCIWLLLQPDAFMNSR
jgi:hypothetical protein